MISNLIGAIAVGNKKEASRLFESIVAQKIDSAIELVKESVADEMYNGGSLHEAYQAGLDAGESHIEDQLDESFKLECPYDSDRLIQEFSRGFEAGRINSVD
jgi:hypothetical protein